MSSSGKRRFAGLVAAVAAVSLGATARAVVRTSLPATSEPPLLSFAVGDSGQVAGGLCISDLNGHLFRLSDPGPDFDPSWSPDGRLVAFTRGTLLWISDAQGRNLQELGRAGNVEWSPDGRKLAVTFNVFSRVGQFGGINIIDADGTDGRVLVPEDRAFVSQASWSPDGSLILYSVLSWDGHVQTYVIGVDGTNRRQLLDSASDPVWSPDGTKFAYAASSSGSGRSVGIGVAEADGSGAHLVVSAGLLSLEAPAWSPDGRQLAYIAGFQTPDGFYAGLGVAQADGSRFDLLASGVQFARPAWSPDGTLIAFTSVTSTSHLVTVIKPDGAGRRTVATAGLAAGDPAWRVPAPLPSNRRPCAVLGTGRADTIRGTDRGDLIFGGGGNDHIYGGGGDDALIGESGQDRLYGAAGDDTIVGGRGRDRLFGAQGEDAFDAKDGLRDWVFGGPGLDRAIFDRHLDRISSIERWG